MLFRCLELQVAHYGYSASVYSQNKRFKKFKSGRTTNDSLIELNFTKL